MKKNIVLLLTAVMGFAVLAGCAGGTKNSTASVEMTGNGTQSSADTDTETGSAAKTGAAQADAGTVSFDWLRQEWSSRKRRQSTMKSFRS